MRINTDLASNILLSYFEYICKNISMGYLFRQIVFYIQLIIFIIDHEKSGFKVKLLFTSELSN